jgi:hypothetical protein
MRNRNDDGRSASTNSPKIPRPRDLKAPNMAAVSSRGTNISANSGCHQCC